MIVPKHNIDTRSEANSVLTQLIQNQEPSERLARAVSASNRVAQQCKDAIIRAHPGISAQEVNLRFIELNYGRELADNVRNFMAGNE
jgi:hypothetical protein